MNPASTPAPSSATPLPPGLPGWVLEVLDDDGVTRHRFPLAPGRHRVGSAEDSSVALGSPGVSRRHALVEVHSDGTLEVIDLGSKNGTSVDGERIERRVLRRSARLGFGGLAVVARRTAAAGLELVVRAANARLSQERTARREAGSTVGTTLHDRLIASLRGRLGGGVRSALELAALWLETLPLSAIEIRRRGFVVARAERPEKKLGAATPAEIDIAGPEGWSLLARAASPQVLERLAEGFGLALEILAAGAGSPPEAPLGRATPAAPTPAPVATTPVTLAPTLRRLYREAERLARGEIPVLVLGESGSGKEVLAAFVHGRSPRAAGPFVAINCAALPAELLEAELFGIEKGVATGVEARPGLLERARGGTVFLDEIGDMPLALQAKVLRVLEGASFYRVGGRQPLTADVRFVAATHVELARRVEEGGFRRDLYFRLAAAPLVLPPLRERREDVPLLAALFYERELVARGVRSTGITRAALGALTAHDWPGNVRELRNEIARAVLMLDSGEPLDVHHLRPELRSSRGDAAPPLSLAAVTAEAERSAFRSALALAEGDPVRARALLDVSRTTYYRKLRELGLDPDGSAPASDPENGTGSGS